MAKERRRWRRPDSCQRRRKIYYPDTLASDAAAGLYIQEGFFPLNVEFMVLIISHVVVGIKGGEKKEGMVLCRVGS